MRKREGEIDTVSVVPGLLQLFFNTVMKNLITFRLRYGSFIERRFLDKSACVVSIGHKSLCHDAHFAIL